MNAQLGTMKKTDYHVFLMRLIRESKLSLCYWIKAHYLTLRFDEIKQTSCGNVLISLVRIHRGGKWPNFFGEYEELMFNISLPAECLTTVKQKLVNILNYLQIIGLYSNRAQKINGSNLCQFSGIV